MHMVGAEFKPASDLGALLFDCFPNILEEDFISFFGAFFPGSSSSCKMSRSKVAFRKRF